MLRLETNPSRNGLGFEEAVRQSFRFVNDYGLLLVESGPTLVRYESKDVFLNVYHGRASYEMGVEIGRLAKEAENDILNAKGALIKEGLSTHTTFQDSSREHVLMLVPKLSSLLKEYADLPRTFQLNQVRRSAKKAWRQKHYTRVIDLYSPWRQYLKQAEATRLRHRKIGVSYENSWAMQNETDVMFCCVKQVGIASRARFVYEDDIS